MNTQILKYVCTANEFGQGRVDIYECSIKFLIDNNQYSFLIRKEDYLDGDDLTQENCLKITNLTDNEVIYDDLWDNWESGESQGNDIDTGFLISEMELIDFIWSLNEFVEEDNGFGLFNESCTEEDLKNLGTFDI